MSAAVQTEKSIFLEAAEIVSLTDRAAFLDRACANDPQLRAAVEALLSSHQQSQGLLDATSTPLAEHAGTQIGPYKLLQQIGEGGMGVVYMAEQLEPVKRRVALKIIKPGMDTRQVIARFEAERQALSLMDHPNIAKVLDAGTTSGGQESGVGIEPLASPTPDSRLLTPGSRPYFVMELVKGQPITQYCDEHHLTPRQRLELLLPVCHAIQHAHQKGIIHRDIKPRNILVAEYDQQAVPKVIDFGVAKAISQSLTEKTMFTGLGQIIGTLEYMSPEQAKLNQLDIDTRSDIYSLGVLLYELLTGSTPFDQARLRTLAFDETLRIIREQEPEKPSTRLSSPLAPREEPNGHGTRSVPTTLASIAAVRGTEPARLVKLVRGELDWIVMKCLEKDRNRRYESANALAADVERYLHDEPVLACPPSAFYQFRKFARRNRGPVAAGLALATLLVLGTVGTSIGLAWALRAERTASAAKEELRRDSYFQRIALAHRELSENNLGRALRLLDECPADLRGWEWHYLMRLCRVEPVILRDETEVNCLAFSLDGEYIAAACGDGAVKVWNSRTRKVVQTLPNAHPDAVFSVAFHPDGKHLASVGADQQVKVWDLTTGQKVFARPCYAVHNNGTAYTVAFSPGDGRQLAAGSDDAVKVWDWRTGRNDEPLHIFPGHKKPRAISVVYRRDGQRLASGSGPGSLKLWDPEAGGEPLLTFRESPRVDVAALAFSPDGGRLATASFGRRVDVWDTTTGELHHSLPHSGLALGVAFSADGRRLASVGEDKVVHLWDPSTGREVLGLRGHTGQCGCVAFSPDGWRLASASKDGTIRVWDATPLQGHEGQETLTFTGHSEEVWSVAVSPDGQKIASAGWRGTPAKVWDARTKKVQVEFSGHKGIVFCVSWQPDSQRIASAGQDEAGELLTVKVWDAQSGEKVFELPPGPEEYYAVAFSPDGKYLVTGRANGKVQVWDARTGDPVGTLGTHDRQTRIRGVVFSHVGGHLASASGDGKVYLWDATRLEEKQEGRTLDAQNQGNGLTVAFSPDGRRLVTGGEKHTAKIWDVETGQELKTLEGHSGDVCAVAFSPDSGGRWVASAGEDSTVRVWDSHTGELRRKLCGHTGLVSSLAFIDETRLVSGSRDKTVKVWDVSQLETVPDR